MACSDRIDRRRSGFTNPYHISRIRGTTHWWFWSGRVGVYHALPTRTYTPPGDFGLVSPQFTIAYQGADLGAGLGCVTFTNLYHRGDTTHKGIGLVAGDQHQVAGWDTVIRVDNVENRREHSRRVSTVAHSGGRHRKENFEIIRPVG